MINNNETVTDIIERWGKGKFNCQVLNRAWTLALGFLLWNMWKERNLRVFQNLEQPMITIWQRSKENIRETILTKKWTDEDWKEVGIEAIILEQLNLKPQMLSPGLWKFRTLRQSIEE